MKYTLKSLEKIGKKYELEADEIKDRFNLIVKSKTRIIFENNISGEEFVVDDDVLEAVLDALGIEITQTVSEKTDKPRRETPGFYCAGNVTGSNIVTGNNNNVSNTYDGLTVIVRGDNLSVGPKKK